MTNGMNTAGHVAHMAAMGLLTSVVAPALVAATRRLVPWHRVPAPPLLTLPLFVLLHGTVTVLMARTEGSAPADTVLHAVLLCGAVMFWLPVLVPRRTAGEPLRAVYLFLAGPSLDLGAIYLIITGDTPGGLAMIVAMMPIGIAALAVAWRWMAGEERAANHATVPGGRR